MEQIIVRAYRAGQVKPEDNQVVMRGLLLEFEKHPGWEVQRTTSGFRATKIGSGDQIHFHLEVTR